MDMLSCMFEDQMNDLVKGEKEYSLEQLKGIDQSLQTYSPEELTVIMDFLCKDPEFKNITRGDPAKLHEYIKQSVSNEDVELAGYVIGQAVGLAIFTWAIWKWVDQKTVRGVADWIDKNGINSVDQEMFEYKARVPQAIEFQQLQAGITKCLPLLGRILDGKSVSDSELKGAMKYLGFNVDLSRFDNYGGHFWAYLVAVVKGLGLSVLATGALVLVTILSLGILYIPAAIAATLWVHVKRGAAYKRAYEEFQGRDSLMSRGWTRATFSSALVEFQKHYKALQFCATRMNKLKGGEVLTPSNMNHTRLFADTLYMAVKVEARVLGTIIAVTDRQLDLRLTP